MVDRADTAILNYLEGVHLTDIDALQAAVERNGVEPEMGESHDLAYRSF